MTERTPKPTTVKTAWVRSHPFPLATSVEEREAEFDRMIAGVERAAAVKALREAKAEFEGTNEDWVVENLSEMIDRIESGEQA